LVMVVRQRAAAETGPESHRRGVEQEQLAWLITRRPEVQIFPPLPSLNARRGRCHVAISLETGAVWQQRRRAGFSTGSEVAMRPRQAEGSKNCGCQQSAEKQV
jgi:hypothetical protein